MGRQRVVTLQISNGGEAPYGETLPGDILSSFSDPILGMWTKPTANSQYLSDLLDLDFTENFTRLRLNIKPNMRFHNGRLLTAQDIEFSLLRGLYTENPTFYLPFLRCIEGIGSFEPKGSFATSQVAGIRTLSDNSLELRLSRPCPEILHTLSLPYFAPRAREALQDDLINWKSLPIGAGPYKVIEVSSDRGEYLVEKTNPSLSGPDRIRILTKNPDGYIPDIVLSRVFDRDRHIDYVGSHGSTPSAVLTLFSSNDHDFVRSTSRRQLLSTFFSRSQMVKAPGQQPVGNFTLTQEAPLPDDRAVQSAKDALIEDVRANWSGAKFEIPVFGRNFDQFQLAVLKELENQFSEVGIKVTFFPLEKKFLDAEDSKKYPFSLAWLVVDPLAGNVMLSSFRRGSFAPFHRADADERLEQLFSSIDAATDVTRKNGLVSDLDQHIVREGYGIPLIRRHHLVFHNPLTIEAIPDQFNQLSLDLTKIQTRNHDGNPGEEPCAGSLIPQR